MPIKKRNKTSFNEGEIAIEVNERISEHLNSDGSRLKENLSDFLTTLELRIIKGLFKKKNFLRMAFVTKSLNMDHLKKEVSLQADVK